MASVISPTHPIHLTTNKKSPAARKAQELQELPIVQSQPVQQQQQSQEQETAEEQWQVLFCKAMYDYTAQDASALSFRRGDIIEVLNQQPSGWWDGLLGDERGWFPSNYVTLISLEEAELAFSGSDYSNGDGIVQSDSDNGVLDMSDAMMGQAQNEEWSDSGVSHTNKYTNKAAAQGSQTNDFWEPNIMDDGRVCVLRLFNSSTMVTSLFRYFTSIHVQESTPGIYLRIQLTKFQRASLLVSQHRTPSEQQLVQEWHSELLPTLTASTALMRANLPALVFHTRLVHLNRGSNVWRTTGGHTIISTSKLGKLCGRGPSPPSSTGRIRVLT
jgi:hypothetical protein